MMSVFHWILSYNWTAHLPVRLHSKSDWVPDISCASSRLPCNSNALYFVPSPSINYGRTVNISFSSKKKEKRVNVIEKEKEIFENRNKIVMGRFGVKETKIEGRKDWTGEARSCSMYAWSKMEQKRNSYRDRRRSSKIERSSHRARNVSGPFLVPSSYRDRVRYSIQL